MRAMLWKPVAILAMVLILCAMSSLVHADKSSLPASGQDAASADIFKQDTLTDDWFGYGKRLQDVGVVLGADEVFDALGNPWGGNRQGAIGEGRFEVFANVDLSEAVGWTGATFHANAYEFTARVFLPATSAIF